MMTSGRSIKKVCKMGRLSLVAGFVASMVSGATAQNSAISNKTYSISIVNKNSVQVKYNSKPGLSRNIDPVLCVLYSAIDPQFGPGQLSEERTPAAGWKKGGKTFDTDLFAAGEKNIIKADEAIYEPGNKRISFRFAANTKFRLNLSVSLPAGDEPPLIQWNLDPLMEGWFSVGFMGLQQHSPASLDFLYLPLVWQWKRFPLSSCLTTESYATTAATYINAGQVSEGIAPDPSEIPYRYVKFEKSRFGLTLRDTAGQAKPMLFAPILGGVESKRKPGEQLSFKCRYLLVPGDWYAGLQAILYNVFHYRNERQNAAVSLNTTLDNMIDYAMDDHYGGWVESLKGFDYSWDVPGTVKVVSALHPLSIALTTGNMEIYKRRALPLMEYVMSREKYLYSMHDSITSQNPSHRLNGPCVEIAELAGLYNMTGGKSFAFRAEAERLFGKPRKLNLLTESSGSTWQDYLARYRITGNAADLDKGKSGATGNIRTEINSFPRDFSNAPGLRDKKSAFYTDFNPKWNDYLEMFETTKDKKYLHASLTGARGLLYWMRSNPMAPDSNILVNKGGRVPGVFEGRRVTQDIWDYFDTSTEVAEQTVPAWQTSFIGITPEQPSTYRVAGPIMLASHAPWLLRLAALSGDTLLRDAAYNSVIGRYSNFPGYYFDNLRTNVYQHADYPLHPYKDMNYNAIFFNHVWPHIAMLQDFLVSDAFLRSGGQVDFPSVYAPGYAFLASKVYGSKAGRIYGNDNIFLWLPKGALKTSVPCFNYLLGSGKNDLYAVIMNTYNRSMKQPIFLDPEKIPWNYDHTYLLEIYDAAGKKSSGTMKNGKLELNVPARGIVTVRIKGLAVDIPLQHKILPGSGDGKSSYVREQTGDSATGTVTGMLLNFTPDFSDAYIYLDVTEKTTRKVTLRYKTGTGDWKIREDTVYPYEFSIHLDKASDKLAFNIETENIEGKKYQAKEMILSN